MFGKAGLKFGTPSSLIGLGNEQLAQTCKRTCQQPTSHHQAFWIIVPNKHLTRSYHNFENQIYSLRAYNNECEDDQSRAMDPQVQNHSIQV